MFSNYTEKSTPKVRTFCFIAEEHVVIVVDGDYPSNKANAWYVMSEKALSIHRQNVF